MMLFGCVLFCLGIIFIILHRVMMKMKVRCSAYVQGVLKEIQNPFNNSQVLYSYTYVVNGTEYELETSDPSPEASKVGDRCTIWYNPKDPSEALSYYNAENSSKILFTIGLVLMPVGVILIVIGLLR